MAPFNHAPAPSSVDQLRAEIDRGATGEKTDNADPAAAPLGTDDEAAGAPISRFQLEQEAAARPAAMHRPDYDARAVAFYIGAIAAIGAVFLAVAIFNL
jgi:hypothetical protein